MVMLQHSAKTHNAPGIDKIPILEFTLALHCDYAKFIPNVSIFMSNLPPTRGICAIESGGCQYPQKKVKLSHICKTGSHTNVTVVTTNCSAT